MVTIDSRFNGPTHSGNGGYVCGLIAGQLHTSGPLTSDPVASDPVTSDPVTSDPVTSTLRQPPPLGTALAWEHDGDEVRLVTAGGALIGESRPGSFGREAPAAPTAGEAAAGTAAYPGYTGHPFSTCFTCGPDRAVGDGLRVFTGPIAPGSTTTAAQWSAPQDLFDADGVLRTEIIWAAIDCAGGWTADFTVHPTVLGRMTAQVLRAPKVDEPCTITGVLDRHEGRKFLTSTALHAGVELLARSEQVWIEIDPANF